MALYYSKDGFPFCAPPYTDEENWEFEQRLRRGGDITIIRQRLPFHLNLDHKYGDLHPLAGAP